MEPFSEGPTAGIRIERDDPGRADVQRLLAGHLADMFATSPAESDHALAPSALSAPGNTFWTARDGAEILGCGALKKIGPGEGEIKSMRTPNALRRTGAGRALLNHIIAIARSRAYRALYLETGRHPAFLPAQTLYASAGFTVCGPFGAYRENGNSVFMSLSLV